jgi:hypothetical protein
MVSYFDQRLHIGIYSPYLLPLLPLMLPPLLGLAHALLQSPQRLSHEVEMPEIVDPFFEVAPSAMFV